jgi:hypothetical protein
VQADAIELAYVNEVGFALQLPNWPARTKSGETHAITIKRGQRLDIIGALLSSGKLVIAKLRLSINGFFAFLMACVSVSASLW